MHQFLSNVLRAPFEAASSLMSKPTGPYVLDTWLGGFPAAMFSRIVFRRQCSESGCHSRFR
jgi:hypothetical protein